MSWQRSFTLWELCEGVAETRDPELSFGGLTATNWRLWLADHQRPYVWPPSRGDLASAIYDLFYVRYGCNELPDDLDAVVLQFVAESPTAAIQALQIACEALPDGRIGPATLSQIKDFDVGQLEDAVLIGEANHFAFRHPWGDPLLLPLLNRVAKVRSWLANRGG